VYTDRLEDIASLGVKAVAIAVPIDKLIEVAKYFITSKINVFVEKPVALNPDDVLELEEERKASGVVVQPGFIVRFDPVTDELKRLITIYGLPKFMEFQRLSRRPERLRVYPIVFDLTIHDIDLTLYLLGRHKWSIKSVTVLEVEGTVTQTLHAVLTYGNTLVSYLTDGNLPVKVRRVSIVFKDVYVNADYVNRFITINNPNGVKTYRVEGEEPLKRELRAFINRIKGQEIPEAPNLNDAYLALRVASLIKSKEPESLTPNIKF